MKNTIDGLVLSQMILSAAAGIENQKKKLNELNVFPVPDGDTGSNMSMTINAGADAMAGWKNAHLGKTSEVIASTLLRGARGNSGVILSLLFRGFSRYVKDKPEINICDFARALQAGVDAAYGAVLKPAEGTILTVSKTSARDMIAAAEERHDIDFAFEKCILSAKAALLKTTDQNPVLKKAGVVDAGAQGYVVLLEGMYGVLTGNPFVKSDEGESGASIKTELLKLDETDIKFVYCTEFIVNYEKKNYDALKLRSLLDSTGDSLVFVNDDDIIKVHVHTNNPGNALEEALKYGSLSSIKIENMLLQHSETVFSGTQDDAEHENAPPERKYGFVAVCAGTGLNSVFKDLGADQIINGGQTMNPSTEDILHAVGKTPAEIVFVLPNNKNIIMAAEQCVHLSEKRVIVIPTQSVPQGVSAMLAADTDADENKNRGAMTDAMHRVKTGLITYAARDSEYDGKKIKRGDYLALLENSLFATDKNIEHLLRKIAKHITKDANEFITLFYGEDISESDAAGAEAIFKSECKTAEINTIFGGQPVYSYIISAE